MSTTTAVLLEKDLDTEYEPDCDCVDGVLELRNVGRKRRSRVQRTLILALSSAVRHLALGALPEQRLRVSATRFRIPDVCVLPLGEDEIVTEPPALCVEIVSPDDRFSKLLQRVDEYLAFGVPVVWIIDPYEYTAWIVTQENPKPHQVDQLRWNHVAIDLRDLLPE
jgi:Uma2 family endonuclease